MIRWKMGALGQKLDNLLQLFQVLPSFLHALDVTGELPGLRDFLNFFQLLNIPSIDPNY